MWLTFWMISCLFKEHSINVVILWSLSFYVVNRLGFLLRWKKLGPFQVLSFAGIELDTVNMEARLPLDIS